MPPYDGLDLLPRVGELMNKDLGQEDEMRNKKIDIRDGIDAVLRWYNPVEWPTIRAEAITRIMALIDPIGDRGDLVLERDQLRARVAELEALAAQPSNPELATEEKLICLCENCNLTYLLRSYEKKLRELQAAAQPGEARPSSPHSPPEGIQE